MSKISQLIIALFMVAPVHAESFILTSEGFASNSLFPELYACDGGSHSPPLHWENPPINTTSFTVVVSDSSAIIPQYHWVLYNIPNAVSALDMDVPILPKGAFMAINSLGKAGYSALCPPRGKMHNYIFTIYALRKMLNIPPGAHATEVIDAMQGYILQTTTINVSYTRWPWAQ